MSDQVLAIVVCGSPLGTVILSRRIFEIPGKRDEDPRETGGSIRGAKPSLGHRAQAETTDWS